MNIGRCPVCHCRVSLEAVVQDEASRELTAEVARLPDMVAKPMLSYLGLFRPKKQDLSNTRAVKLLNQVLEMYRADHVLASALVETVGKIRAKRVDNNDSPPLTNHNYLKKVYESMATKLAVAATTKEKVKTPIQQEQDNSWYFEQAKRMQNLGQDPLASTIGEKLKELCWQP